MKILQFILSFGLLVSCENIEKESKEANKQSTPISIPEKIDYEAIVLEISTSEFGYQIMKNGELLIEQKNIPAVQGNKTFSSRSDAQKVAIFAVNKIKNGSFPPTISIEELDSLGILHEGV